MRKTQAITMVLLTTIVTVVTLNIAKGIKEDDGWKDKPDDSIRSRWTEILEADERWQADNNKPIRIPRKLSEF